MASTAWKAHERAVAVALSNWLSGGRSSEVLSRQALHGRMVERIWGDLAVHPACPAHWRPRAVWFMDTFFVDAKRRGVFSLPALMGGADHPFWGWLTKARDQAGAKHALVVCMDRRQRFVCGPLPGVALLAPMLRVYRNDGSGDCAALMELHAWLRATEPEYWGCPRDP